MVSPQSKLSITLILKVSLLCETLILALEEEDDVQVDNAEVDPPTETVHRGQLSEERVQSTEDDDSADDTPTPTAGPLVRPLELPPNETAGPDSEEESSDADEEVQDVRASSSKVIEDSDDQDTDDPVLIEPQPSEIATEADEEVNEAGAPEEPATKPTSPLVSDNSMENRGFVTQRVQTESDVSSTSTVRPGAKRPYSDDDDQVLSSEASMIDLYSSLALQLVTEIDKELDFPPYEEFKILISESNVGLIQDSSENRGTVVCQDGTTRTLEMGKSLTKEERDQWISDLIGQVSRLAKGLEVHTLSSNFHKWVTFNCIY